MKRRNETLLLLPSPGYLQEGSVQRALPLKACA